MIDAILNFLDRSLKSFMAEVPIIETSVYMTWTFVMKELMKADWYEK